MLNYLPNKPMPFRYIDHTMGDLKQIFGLIIQTFAIEVMQEGMKYLFRGFFCVWPERPH